MFENVITAETLSAWTERSKNRTNKRMLSDFQIFTGRRATHLQTYATFQEKGLRVKASRAAMGPKGETQRHGRFFSSLAI